MNTFKSHLSLVFALVVMLLAIQSVVSMQRIINDYAKKIADEYYIVAVSSVEISNDDAKKISKFIDFIELIDSSVAIEEIKGDLSAANIALLKTSLPKFYRVKLTKYPSANELKEVEKALLNTKDILKIESFAKNQNNLYSVLILNKTIITVFSVLIFLIALLLVVRQMEVWRLKHSERMQIMSIFGAAMWLRSAVLYRLAVVDSIVSVFIVALLFYILSSSDKIEKYLLDIGLNKIVFDIKNDLLVLFLVSFGISILSVFYVIIKSEQDK